jgi:hypothetical protein
LDREPLKRHEASVNNEFTLFTDTANPALARTMALSRRFGLAASLAVK